MRVFITGASGWVGSAVTAELIATGHQVVGLARSDASAEKVASLGADVQPGDITDLDSLRAGADGVDGIIHTGYSHDFSRMAEAAAMDATAVNLFGDLLEGTGKPLLIASGILGAVSVETDRPDPASAPTPRLQTEHDLLGFADRGVRSAAIRFASTVHGEGDHGFIATLVGLDRQNGTSAYVGTTRWPAVHRLDAAHLVCLALENGKPGSVYHAIGEGAVPLKDVAEVIGRHLDLPVEDISPEVAGEKLSWLGRFLSIDSTATSDLTQAELGWKPTHNTLLEDLEAGYYFK
jgi:nucleoside-diphosphate-sugar epimerase